MTRYYYDGSWRLVEESTEEIATDDFGSSLTQRVWSPHYIDALIFAQTDTDLTDDMTDADGLYALCDRSFVGSRATILAVRS